jgi:pyruvate dehydrogenase E2 component (dihydrolipoamide acetyltransferase)
VAFEVILPRVDMDMTNGTIRTWYAREGDRVVRGAALFEIETGKAAMEIDAPTDGILGTILVPAGGMAPVGSAVAYIFEEGESPETHIALPSRSPPHAIQPDLVTFQPAPQPQLIATRPDQETIIRATPLARRMAREAGLALNAIAGSGPSGRITADDVRLAGQAGRNRPLPMMMSLVCRLDRLLELLVRINDSAPKNPDGTPQWMIPIDALVVKALALALHQGPDMTTLRSSELVVSCGTAGIIHHAARQPLARIAEALENPLHSAPASPAAMLWTFLADGVGIEQFTVPFDPPTMLSISVGALSERVAIVDGKVITVRETNCTLLADPNTLGVPAATEILSAFRRFLEDPLLMLA